MNTKQPLAYQAAFLLFNTIYLSFENIVIFYLLLQSSLYGLMFIFLFGKIYGYLQNTFVYLKGKISPYFNNFMILKSVLYMCLYFIMAHKTLPTFDIQPSALQFIFLNTDQWLSFVLKVKNILIISSAVFLTGYSQGKSLKLIIKSSQSMKNHNVTQAETITYIFAFTFYILLILLFFYTRLLPLNLWLKLALIQSINIGVTTRFIELPLLQSFMHGIINMFVTLALKRKITTKEMIIESSDEPKLIVCNHGSLFDSLIIGSCFFQKLSFPIYIWWSQFWAVRNILTHIADMHPMTPEDPKSMLAYIKALRSGKSGVIFPEGALSSTGNFMKFFEGALF